jgi:hypothetical protein
MNLHFCSLLSDPAWWNPIGFPAVAILQDYFRPITRLAGASEVATYLMPQASNVKDDDLLVYVVSRNSSFTSIVAHRNAAMWASNPTRSGLTSVLPRDNNAIVSEVYWEKVQGDPDMPHLLANLIFHEFMHNKLDAVEHQGEDFVHLRGGGGLAVPGGLSAADRPNDANNRLMAQVVGRRHLQYTDYLKASDIPPAPRLKIP